MTVKQLLRAVKIPIPAITTSEELAETNKQCWSAAALGLIYSRLATNQKFSHDTITKDINEIWDEFQTYLETVDYQASPTKILKFAFRKCQTFITGYEFGPDVSDLEAEDSEMLNYWGALTKRNLIIECISEEPSSEMMHTLHAFIAGKIERLTDEPDWRHFVIAHVETAVGMLEGTIPVRFNKKPDSKAADPQLP